MRKIRVLVAQGPAQLTFCLATWDYLAGQPGPGGAGSTVDILVLGGFGAGQEVAAGMDQTCRQIASIWTFDRIVSTTELDSRLGTGLLSFQDYLNGVVNLIGPDPVAEVYVCRNMQPLNEAVLWAFPQARKVCYGDLGYIDLDGASWCQPLLPEGYPAVDEIQCVGPQEMTPGLFDRLPVTNIPSIHLTKILRRASTATPQLTALCQELGAVDASHRILVCLSNLIESGTVNSVEDEIEFYCDCLRPHLTPGAMVIIKGHPRETFRQSHRLVERLHEQGVKVCSLSTLSVVPVDFMACHLRIDLFISLVSCSAVWWRLLQPESSLLIGVPLPLLRRYFSPAALENLSWELVAPHICLQAWMATQGNFQPLRFSAIEMCRELAPASPVFLPGVGPAEESSPAIPADPVLMRFHAAVLARSRPTPVGFRHRLLQSINSWFPSLPKAIRKAP